MFGTETSVYFSPDEPPKGSLSRSQLEASEDTPLRDVFPSVDNDSDLIKVLWRQGEPFSPEGVSEALQTEAKTIDHPSFGEGFSWKLARTEHRQVSARFEFYPANRVARLKLADGPGDYQTSEYTVDQMKMTNVSESTYLVFTSKRGDRYTTVNLYPNGEVDEFHRHTQTSPGRRFMYEPAELPNVAQGTFSIPPEFIGHKTMSIAQAARIIGCEHGNVRYLVKQGRLAGYKKDGVYFVDVRSVGNYHLSNRGRKRSRP